MAATRSRNTDKLIAELEPYQTRANARRQLAALGATAAEPLLAVIKDPERPLNMRWAAVTLLEELKYQPAVPALLEILRNEPNLVGEAARALAAITGKDIGESLEDWEAAITGKPVPTAEVEPEATITPEPVATPDEQVALVKAALAGTADEVAWDECGGVYVLMPVGERKQQLLVSLDSKDDNGEPAALIYTECGEVGEGAATLVAIANQAATHGQFKLEDDGEGNEKIIMCHFIPAAEVTPQTIGASIRAMATAADALEAKLTGQDLI